MHVHIIVSRKDKSNTLKLSPLTNDRKQFNQVEMKGKCHRYFDTFYNYIGSGIELENFLKEKYGATEERIKYFNHLEEMRKANQPEKKEESSVLKEEEIKAPQQIPTIKTLPVVSKGKEKSKEEHGTLKQEEIKFPEQTPTIQTSSVISKEKDKEESKDKKQDNSKSFGIGGGFSF